MTEHYKATKKGLESACEDKVRIGVSKTAYLIKDRLWLWDDENDMLIAVLQRSNKKVLYKSPYIRLSEKRMGITLDELLKRFLMGGNRV